MRRRADICACCPPPYPTCSKACGFTWWKAATCPPAAFLEGDAHLSDRSYNSDVRSRTMPQLLCARQEYCSANDMTHVVGLILPLLFKHFGASGITCLARDDLVEGEIERPSSGIGGAP